MAQAMVGRPDAPVAPEVEAVVQEALRRPFRMVVQGTPDEGYLAEAPELPGCVTAGETPEEAMTLLRDAMAAWLTVAVERRNPIPEPAHDFSGKFVLRLPKTLHQRLAARATAEGISLNQLAATYVARGVGSQEGQEQPSMEYLIETAAGLSSALRKTLIAAEVWRPFDPANGTIYGSDGRPHVFDPALVAGLVEAGFLKRKPLPGMPPFDNDVIIPPASAAALRLADQLFPS
jgi:antitoxin HicB